MATKAASAATARRSRSALIAVAGIDAGQRVLDVGAGTGALSEQLAAVVGAGRVSAVDLDSDALVVLRHRVPGVDARVARAETLPYADAEFDATLAQLVLTLVDDGPRAAAQMRRVTRPGGVVAACVWDFSAGMTVLRAFWDSASTVAPRAAAEHDQARTRPYATLTELERLWGDAGLRAVTTGALVASTRYRDFDDLWQPLTMTDGAPGLFLATLDDDQRARQGRARRAPVRAARRLHA
jgi:ubiquinone/menaquinone biosynthesis C-methylase UbiE